jgi:hypothetical protein
MRRVILYAVVIIAVLGIGAGTLLKHRPTSVVRDPRAAALEKLPLDELAKEAGVNPIMVSELDRQDLILQILNPPPGLTEEELARVKAVQNRVQAANESRIKSAHKGMAEDQRRNSCVITGLQVPGTDQVGSEGSSFSVSAQESFTQVRFWLCQAPDVKFFVNGRDFWPKCDSPAILRLHGPTKSVSIRAERLDPNLPGTIELMGITVQ